MPWILSFPETVAIAQRYRASRHYWDAAVEFEKAARVAPTEGYETAMLEEAFACLELVGWARPIV